MANNDLTPKQARFVEEYLIDLNGTQAAIRAGYSPKTANEQAARLLANASVAAAVAEAQQARSERTQITQDRVLKEYARLAFSDMRNLMAWDAQGMSLKTSADLSEDVAACVAEVTQTVTKDGGSMKLKVHDKKGALDSVAKHLGMFVERHAGADGGPMIVEIVRFGARAASGSDSATG
ncbi:MAG TPA: terminase small subunit [Salinarimonas sp.]|nr:terminase small subunit [Salinarimonas sp.]